MENEIPYILPVLTGSGNYKTWARDMTFALQDAKIWSYLTEEHMLPPALKKTEDDDEDRQNEIFERHEARLEHQECCRKVIEKIGRMCSHTVQQEILSVKQFQIKAENMETSPGTGKMTTISTVNITSRQVLVALQYNWTPLELWNHLKEYYTPRGWSAKWSIFNKLQQMSYQEHKNITEYEAQFREVMSEIRDQNLIMEEAVTLQFRIIFQNISDDT